MALTMREKQAVTKELARRYARADRKTKATLIAQVTNLTGYNRSYVTRLLRTCGRQLVLTPADGPPLLLTAARRDLRFVRARPRIYNEQVLVALRRAWYVADCICGKRLAPFLPELVPLLERHGELMFDKDTRARLPGISAAAIDRLLADEKQQLWPLVRVRAKPNSLLQQIPMVTHAEQQADRPGYVQVDLVGHDGGCVVGEYCQTLDVTDPYSGWTELQAVRNKAQHWVTAALRSIRDRLPFPLLGIHSDSGGEFINEVLYAYCLAEGLVFTRSRPYQKNDNC